MDKMTKQSLNKKCILCRKNKATTREHFPFKAEILRENRFPMPIINLFGKADKIGFKAKSHKSKNFKPIKNLCNKCNNENTHKFDITFSVFHEYLTEEAICFVRKEDSTRFNAVIDVEDENHETYVKTKKYFAKILACQMDKEGYSIPKKLRDMALSDKDDKSFILRIFIEPMVKIDNWEQEGEKKLGFKFAIGYSKDKHKKNVEIDVAYGHLDYAFIMEVERFPAKIKTRFLKPIVWSITKG